VNAAKILNMRGNPLLRRDVLSSDLILADGMSVVWASRLLGCPVPERVTGIDLMTRILQRGNELGWRVYCLGATDDVLRRVVQRIGRTYSNVKIVGAKNGYYGEQEEALIASEIAAARPDILLIAITSPKKERFLARWTQSIQVPVCHGVGGSFDVMAGKVRRAPAAWQRFGLEWAYRLAQEPRRLWRRYLVTNSKFCWLVLQSLLAKPFVRQA
jgi:N-acetylglucosaminyldiphosphoundecaprenol N-acetyl-beta-D-mannosaminyltransferase